MEVFRDFIDIIKRLFFFRTFLIIYFLLCFNLCQGQFIVDEEPKMLYYERTHQRIKNPLRMKNFRDVFHKDKLLMGKNRIMGSISYNSGRVLIDEGGIVFPETRQALAFFTRIRFFEEFSFNTIFYKDYNLRASGRWISDYNYSIGRYNWREHKFNFGYENYINNKYSDPWKIVGRKFLEGYYFISYNHLPKGLNYTLRIDSTSSLRFIYFSRYAIKYRDEREVTHGGLFSGKPTVGVAFRYTLLWNIYFETAAYYYFLEEKQQPWDPDYSYGFGYFDWRSFRLSVTYGNWAINRFPWNNSGLYKNYGFPDGNFRIAGNWIW